MALSLYKPKPQTNEYIKTILKSGLLLEEDMDYVLMHYKEDYDHNNKMPIFEKLVHGISFSTSFLLIYKKLTYFVPIATTPMLVLGIYRVRALLQQRRRRTDILILIESVYLTMRLNRSLVEYFKERDHLSETGDIINPYTDMIKSLIEVVFKEECHMLAIYLKFVREFGCHAPFLYKNFEYLEYVELIDYDIKNVDSIKDCIQLTKRLSEVYLLVTSNVLTCLCVAICPEVVSRLNLKVVEILDRLLPKMKIVAKSCYELVNNKFVDVKYFYLNTADFKNIKKPIGNRSRLYAETENMLAKSSDILGQSYMILEKLQQNKLDSYDEKQIICNNILNLRNQVHDFYESLGVLHSLYEININRPKTIVTINEPILQPTNSSSKIDIVDASLNSVEPAEDEEYELYIGANDTFERNYYTDYDEEESLKYASAINRELKQKLKKHARFIAARQKLGLVEDDEPENARIESESSDDERKSKSMPATPRPLPRNPRRSRIPRSLPLTPRRGAVRRPGDPIDFDAGAGPSNARPGPPENNAGQDAEPPAAPPALRPIPQGPYGDVASSYYNVDDFLETINNEERPERAPEEVYEVDLTNDESD